MSEPLQETIEVPKLVAELPRLVSKHEGAIITADPHRNAEAIVVEFPFKDPKARVTIRVLFNDHSGSDIVITNITTLPNEEVGKGLGKTAINYVLEWAREIGANEVRAVQVQPHVVPFWTKCSFVQDKNATSTKDFIFKL